jgi:hypothetical protein
MNHEALSVTGSGPSTYHYPESHWQVLRRFVIGNERDPKDLFSLADDIWEVWPYALHGRPSEAFKHRLHFGHLKSFLKPYVKWYCYQRLMSDAKAMTAALKQLPYVLTRTDVYLVEQGLSSLDDIASPFTFEKMWNALLSENEAAACSPRGKYARLSRSRPFWEYVRTHFGVPHRVPALPRRAKSSPTASAADDRNVIPQPVIGQLVNVLALHREGCALLNPFHHLRLCVLVLLITTGRRADEILTAPRSSGPEGPLNRHPARGGPPEGELWFQFAPRKHGSRDEVYISPTWCDITRYCVQSLLGYSDCVRASAPPEEQHFLILVSRWNDTRGTQAAYLSPGQAQKKSAPANASTDQEEIHRSPRKATGLSYSSFHYWLNGKNTPQGHTLGFLDLWKITRDGETGGEIYHLRTHQARHTRQTAIARDSTVSPTTRQYDLNHIHPDMQFAYQHVLREQHETLQQKAREGLLLGPAIPWVADLLGSTYQQADRQPQFHLGQPTEISLRWRHLIVANPHFLQFNRVPCGYCTLPQGPQGCQEYMNCLEAEGNGCRWFATDPENEQMLIQITERAQAHRKRAEQSRASGRTVQAEKYELLAQRAEALEGEALRHASQDLRARLAARRREVEERQ